MNNNNKMNYQIINMQKTIKVKKTNMKIMMNKSPNKHK